MTACTRHDPRDYLAGPDPKRPGWYVVHCRACGQRLGSPPQDVEDRNRGKLIEQSTRGRKKAG